jgi:hypothetical protein
MTFTQAKWKESDGASNRRGSWKPKSSIDIPASHAAV